MDSCRCYGTRYLAGVVHKSYDLMCCSCKARKTQELWLVLHVVSVLAPKGEGHVGGIQAVHIAAQNVYLPASLLHHSSMSAVLPAIVHAVRFAHIVLAEDCCCC